MQASGERTEARAARPSESTRWRSRPQRSAARLVRRSLHSAAAVWMAKAMRVEAPPARRPTTGGRSSNRRSLEDNETETKRPSLFARRSGVQPTGVRLSEPEDHRSSRLSAPRRARCPCAHRCARSHAARAPAAGKTAPAGRAARSGSGRSCAHVYHNPRGSSPAAAYCVRRVTACRGYQRLCGWRKAASSEGVTQWRKAKVL
jgi:hypothetical protein